MGHNGGLYHDGTSSLGYYEGHGTGPTGWAPIMGVGYYKQLVQVRSIMPYHSCHSQHRCRCTRPTPPRNHLKLLRSSSPMSTRHVPQVSSQSTSCCLPRVQWSRGEYAGANNKEDDFAVMNSNGLRLRTDDFGNTSATASALTGGPISAGIPTSPPRGFLPGP